MLEYGTYYHIYNKGVNNQNIFNTEIDYMHFLNLMDIFLLPVADIYAYALMKNHLHLVIRVNEKEEIGFLDPKYSDSKNMTLKWKTFFPINNKEDFTLNKKPIPEKMLQHMFNAYAQWFNNKHNRSGQLFKHPYNRIPVQSVKYLKRLIIYVHRNPVKHGFCDHPIEYGWTSYNTLISIKPTKLFRERVLGWFDDRANFKISHNNENDNFMDIRNIFLE
jgi:REP element-mobilizing transposase RayT